MQSAVRRKNGGTKFVTFHFVEDPEITHEAQMLVTEFDRWVADNNIPERFEYGKGWWDYVELIRRFAHKFDIPDVRVVGHYVVRTPPPEEELPMPAVGLTKGSVLIAMKWDFGAACR